jgi:hypothetical protein
LPRRFPAATREAAPKNEAGKGKNEEFQLFAFLGTVLAVVIGVTWLSFVNKPPAMPLDVAHTAVSRDVRAQCLNCHLPEKMAALEQAQRHSGKWRDARDKLNSKEIFMRTETTKSFWLNLFAPAILLAFLLIDTQAQSEKPPSPKADPAAWNLLKAARETREVLPDTVKHVAAQLVFNDNGDIKTGTVSYDVQSRAVIQMEGLSDEAKAWVEDQVNSVLAHRRNGDFNKADGRHPITFAANDKDDKSLLGRRVELHDSMKSSYRIRNHQVVEVDRTMADDHFVITVLETTPTTNGKFLPRTFVVNYFDAKTGALKRNEAFTDEYQNIDGVWLPALRRIVKAAEGKLTTRILEFRAAKVTRAEN